MRYVLLGLMMVWCGCSPSASDDYFPLAVGNEWIMEQTADVADGRHSVEIYHRKIEGIVDKDGKRYFRFRIWREIGESGRASSKLMRKDEKAVYFIDELNGATTEQSECVLPLKVGVSWKRTEGGRTMTETVVEKQSLQISGRTCDNCYHIHGAEENGVYTEDQWEAPGIGEVKAQHGRPGVTFSERLIEFKPGK